MMMTPSKVETKCPFSDSTGFNSSRILTDHTAVRLHGHNEGQLCYEERDTEVDVDVVPHAP